MHSLKLLTVATVTAVIGLTAFAQTSGTAPLSVTVDGVRNGNGKVIVAAFDEAGAFETMDVNKAVALTMVPAATSTVTFHNRPSGGYAFAAMHDEDQNGDQGMKGDVPSEGYAFAAMGRPGLPSKFEDAVVATGKGATSTLSLKYWD